ncbi:MAG: signal peptide peptidase SppA [Pseudomonadota bacterium]
MALDVDTLMDRRRLIRRVTAWRAVAVLAVIGAVTAVVLTQVELGQKHVARIAVQGAILSDRPLLQLVERLRKDDDVAALLVSIDSPGGTSVGGERLYEALRAFAADKPVVSHVNTLGASAAYMTALATDHIVAQRTSLTGSIGVIVQYGRVEQLLESWGIEVSKVVSGPLKAEPNPFDAPTPAAVAALQAVVDNTFDWFLGLVVERRDMTEARARTLADGRIFTGAQALENGLVDELGGEDDAVAWLTRERGVERDLPVRTYRPSRRGDGPLGARWGERLLAGVISGLGLPISPNIPMTSIDGLWMIWHPGILDSEGVHR